MWPDTRLMDIFGIEYPIIQAPMAGASTPAMAAAAANNGCMGSLGCAMMKPDVYIDTFNKTRSLTNGALNMNFFCHVEPVEKPDRNERAFELLKPFYEEMGQDQMPDAVATHFPFGDEIFEAVLQACPNVMSFHFGLPNQKYVDALKERGVKILCSATTAAEAREQEARGVDAVIAQGWEAGGHHGFYLEKQTAAIGTFALVPQLVDAVDIPVIAAGGIADGRGIAAALALGASGVQIGTAFLTTEETGIPEVHKNSLLASDGSNTQLTRIFSGRPARGLQNRYMDEIKPFEDELPDFPLMNTLTGPLRKFSAENDKPDFVAQWSGQAVSLNRTGTTAELIQRLVEETQSVIGKLQKA